MTATNEFNMPQARILLPRLVYEKIMYFVMKNTQECSGLGVTEIVGGNIIVRDIIMVKQKNGYASTDMEAEDVAKAMYHFHKHKGEMNYWWHSHGNMDVFWSGTDKETIGLLGVGGMCVASVFNRDKKIRSAIAAMKPFPFVIDDVETIMEPLVIADETIAAWDAEYDANVYKPPVYTGTTNVPAQRSFEDYDYGYGGYKDKDEDWKNDWEKDPETKEWRKKNVTNIRSKKRTSSEFYTMQEKIEFAKSIDEVVNYHRIDNEYELLDGSFVNCDDFIDQITEGVPHGVN